MQDRDKSQYMKTEEWKTRENKGEQFVHFFSERSINSVVLIVAPDDENAIFRHFNII